jgi:hypothetical protein
MVHIAKELSRKMMQNFTSTEVKRVKKMLSPLIISEAERILIHF